MNERGGGTEEAAGPSALRALLAARRGIGRRLRERALLILAPTEARRIFVLTALIGGVCGLAAVSFHLSIRAAEALLIQRALAVPGRGFIGWTLALATAGGLLVGLALRWFPAASGSGIPQMKAAYLLPGRPLPLASAVAKFVLTTLQVGSGAALGREGPTVQICGTLATLLGRGAALPREKVRRLIPVGAAAGIAAAFNAPMAAVTFTVEELLGALDQTVLSGVVVAAALAAAIERSVLGEHPVLEVTRVYGLVHASSLLLYAALGLLAAGVSLLFCDGLIAIRARFRRRGRVPGWAQPALGMLACGALVVAARLFFDSGGVNGGGYEVLNQALHAHLGLRLLLGIGALKLLATLIAYGSGGVGGVFAPVLFIGAMLGGAVGTLDQRLLAHGPDAPGAFALVGMGALFAGVIRAPITSVLIIFEMTGSYGLILPLMVSNMTAYALARRLRPTTLYDALLEQDGVVLPHRRILGEIAVGEAMSAPVEVLPESAGFEAILARMEESSHSAFPVLDGEGRLRGLLTLGDLRPHLRDLHLGRLVVAADLCRPDTPVATAEESLEAALHRMTASEVDHLPVVTRGDRRRVIGMLTRRDILNATARLEAHARQAEVEAEAAPGPPG